jgi:hypothetical protein
MVLLFVEDSYVLLLAVFVSVFLEIYAVKTVPLHMG